MPWVTVLIIIPLFGALSMGIVPAGGLFQARLQAALAAGLTLVMSLIMLGHFHRSFAGPQFVEHAGWATQVGLDWNVWVDGISIWLIILTTGLFALAVGYLCFRTPERPRAFLALILLAEVGLLGLFSAGNLVLFYVFWELMLVPFYFMIGMWGGPGRQLASIKFVIYTMFGSLLMLVSIVSTAVIAHGITGIYTFDILALRNVAYTRPESIWLLAGFLLAFVIKLPLWPFHGWLPDAYRTSPIVVVGLLAAVVSKAGVYGLLRIGLPLFPRGMEFFQYPIMLLALVSIVYGSVVAWRQPTMRMLVGYSSLAHVGFIALGIAAIDSQAAQGAVLQMVNHGVVVVAAFAIVGIISSRTGKEEIDDIGGLAAGAPWLAGLFLVVTMASLAIPGSNSFAGEFFILAGVFRHDWWAASIAMIGVVYASVYMLRLYQSSMNGPTRGADPRRAELKVRDVVVLVPLISVMLFIALWPQVLVGASSAAVDNAVAPAQVVVGRPASEIHALVLPNPLPATALPSATSSAGGSAQ
jgi:NADH-quinone oxidoreductase subunit M